jgi:tetratricopeptide (TPR) repeat protein
MIAPDFAVAYFKLGVCLGERGQYRQAIGHYRKAIQLKPDSPEPYINMGNLLCKMDQLSDAVPCYRRAIQLKPASVKPYYFLGSVLREMGALRQSIIVTKKALKIDPSYAEARFSMALSLLLAGDYANGWKAYDARMKLNANGIDYPYIGERPLWDGGEFRGKTLLVHSEQGFGDILQFVRFLPLVKQLGGRVIFQTFSPLLDLLKDFPGMDQLIGNPGDPLPPEAFDLYIPLLSVPGRLGTLVDTIPASVPYLFAAQEKEKLWRGRIEPDGLRIGLVWTGNPEHGKDKARSCHLSCFERISRIPGVRLHGLQKEVPNADRSVSENMGMPLLGELFRDFSDTAAAIHQLDLVISVDTAVAHLAGAMGKPTWILLAKRPDFRWLTRRTDSPWYPTVRLYRQETQGDWSDVLAKVCRDVAALAVSRR